MQRPTVPQPPKIVLPPVIQTGVPRPVTANVVQPTVVLPQPNRLNNQTGQVTPTITVRPNVPIPAVVVPPHIARPTVTVPKPIVAPIVVNPTVPVMVPKPQVATPNLPQQLTLQATVPRTTAFPPPHGGILRQFEGGGGNVGVVTVTTAPQITTAPVINIVQETGYSILQQLVGLWQGTEEQIQQLVQLQYENGTSIIDPNRRDVIMEVIGMLIAQNFDEVVDFLTDAPNPEFVLWEQESMDEGRIKVIREINIQQAEEVGVKGVGKCKYCPSTELVFATKQLRSADEAMTIFVRCVMCQKQWRQ